MLSNADGDYFCGELVLARVYNALENRSCKGKVRPVVLVEEHDGHWLCAGLTTNPRLRDGRAREAIPNPAAVGLRGPGYMWGNRTHTVSRIDLERVIGVVDPALAELIIRTHPMTDIARDDLRWAGCDDVQAEIQDLPTAG